MKAYDWKFATVGGVTRVNIESGADIAHLDELDKKMWTVLSCPVKGLEIDEQTLALMDSDQDGKIRVDEVVSSAKWVTTVLKDPELLIRKADTVALADINTDTEEGQKVYNSAVQILKNLGLGKDSISIADTADRMAIFAKTKFNGDGIITENSADDEALKALIATIAKTHGTVEDRSGDPGIDADRIDDFFAQCADFKAWHDAATPEILPFGDRTAEAYEAYAALNDKVADYFMRCKMAAYDAETIAALDVNIESVQAISNKNLSLCADEIASYPLARIPRNNSCELLMNEAVNPAWAAQYCTLTAIAFENLAANDPITEADWAGLADKFAPFVAWQAEKKGAAVEALGIDAVNQYLQNDSHKQLLALVEQDKALETEMDAIQSVDKLLHLCRDLFTLVNNFVTFSDFYTRNPQVKAIFQAGTLFIDQRSCDLCIRVNDMGAQNAMAAASGMYLIYCDCTNKTKSAKMTIVAVMTQGEVSDLMVGKNAIFYDRQGNDWDAVVTKIVDNPISIGQAFWSPYRKFGKFITDSVGKFASDKDEKMTADVTGKMTDASSNLVETSQQAAADGAKPAKPAKQAFDMSKFLGLFAVIGMALGTICGFLLDLLKGFVHLQWWGMIVVIAAILLIISGPSMLLAWMKLRKRNLSPVLNANGWAINAQTLVNIPFGATLTQVAKFPAIAMADPFGEKKHRGRWFWIIVLLLAIAFGALYFTNNLKCIGLAYKDEPAQVEDSVAPEAQAAEAAAVEAQTDAETDAPAEAEVAPAE